MCLPIQNVAYRDDRVKQLNIERRWLQIPIRLRSGQVLDFASASPEEALPCVFI